MGPALVLLATAWTANVDLDGDGKADTATVEVTKSKTRSIAKVTVGSASLELEVPDGTFGGVDVKVIDIDPTDHAQEILVTHLVVGEEEDPPNVFEVVTYVGGALHVTTLASTSGYNTGVATVANHALTLVYDDCPDKLTVLYVRKDDKIVESKRSKVRTKNPDTCAG